MFTSRLYGRLADATLSHYLSSTAFVLINADDDDSYSRIGDQVEVGESDKIYETWEKLTMSQTKQSVAEIRSTLQVNNPS